MSTSYPIMAASFFTSSTPQPKRVACSFVFFVVDDFHFAEAAALDTFESIPPLGSTSATRFFVLATLFFAGAFFVLAALFFAGGLPLQFLVLGMSVVVFLVRGMSVVESKGEKKSQIKSKKINSSQIK